MNHAESALLVWAQVYMNQGDWDRSSKDFLLIDHAEGTHSDPVLSEVTLDLMREDLILAYRVDKLLHELDHVYPVVKARYIGRQVGIQTGYGVNGAPCIRIVYSAHKDLTPMAVCAEWLKLSIGTISERLKEAHVYLNRYLMALERVSQGRKGDTRFSWIRTRNYRERKRAAA